MTAAFDPRIIKVTIRINGETHTFQDLAINARGTILGSPLQNQCEIQIFNLEKEIRNFIITQASPLKSPRTNVPVTLEVGRQSYGTFKLYEGNVIAANVTQPPDIGITLTSLTSNFLQGIIQGVQQPAMTSSRQIAQSIAKRYGLALNFQATPKQIENYYFSGALTTELRHFERVGGINAFLTPDNSTLVVIDSNKALSGDARLIKASTGMIGVPQVTDRGVDVQVMIDNSIRLGGSVKVESEINPAANGTFKVVQMNFDVANRDQPFWYLLKTSNLAQYQGTQ